MYSLGPKFYPDRNRQPMYAFYMKHNREWVGDIHSKRQFLLALDLQLETLNKLERIEIEYFK